MNFHTQECIKNLGAKNKTHRLNAIVGYTMSEQAEALGRAKFWQECVLCVHMIPSFLAISPNLCPQCNASIHQQLLGESLYPCIFLFVPKLICFVLFCFVVFLPFWQLIIKKKNYFVLISSFSLYIEV